MEKNGRLLHRQRAITSHLLLTVGPDLEVTCRDMLPEAVLARTTAEEALLFTLTAVDIMQAVPHRGEFVLAFLLEKQAFLTYSSCCSYLTGELP